MLTRKSARTVGLDHEPEQLDPVQRGGRSRRERQRQERPRPANASARIGAPAYAGRVRGRSARGKRRQTGTARAVARPLVRASRVGYSDPPKRAARRVRPSRCFAPQSTRPECSDPSARSPILSPRSTSSWICGASVGRSRGCAPRTRAVRAGASSTGRSRPITRWASTTPGAAPTRTSTSASTRCSARTSATRTASTARACGSRSTSSATSASRPSATSRRSASPSS